VDIQSISIFLGAGATRLVDELCNRAFIFISEHDRISKHFKASNAEDKIGYAILGLQPMLR